MKATFVNPSAMLARYLGLSAPVTIKELKSGYRKKAMEYHPDLNPNGTELFKEFQQVYEWLTSPGIMETIAVAGEVELVSRTIDGIPLSELGLGFDNTKNGIDCPDCSHTGYKRVVEEKIHLCRECFGAGYAYANTCTACTGTGKFTQKNSKKVVDFLRCKGAGTIHYRTLTRCTACVRGYVTNRTEKVTFHTCYRCRGVGELEIFNPVIRKGLLGVSV